MQTPYRLFGAELSPYSLKVRTYLRYKGADFVWRARTASEAEEFSAYAKLPLIPVLVSADEQVLQDSTPMIEALEGAHPAPAIVPEAPALGFISALLEDYADEWLVKAMFHYRWTYPADQDSAARRLTDGLFPEGGPDGAVDAIRTRMIGRLHHVGSNAQTGPVIEASLRNLLDILDVHLAGRDYLFGGRPALADFGLAAQLWQMLSDPTAGAIIREAAPRVAAWAERMQAPAADGPFEAIEHMGSSLRALLSSEVAGAYLPWMKANAEAVSADAPAFSVTIGGVAFSQKPQRYAAKAFGELRRKRALLADDVALASLLGETGCDAFLEPPTSPPAQEDDRDSDDEDAAGEAAADAAGADEEA